MKFSIHHKTLSDAVAWSCNGLAARPVVPVLEGITVTAGTDGTVTLAGFDYEQAYTMRMPGHDVSEPGTALVPGRQVRNILKGLPKTVVVVEFDGSTVTFRAGTSVLSVAAMPADEYPALPPMPAQAGTVDAAELSTAILQVAPAVGRDGTLPVLTCVSVEAGTGAFTLTATDRYRLHTAEVPWFQHPVSGRGMHNVPVKPLTLFAKALGKAKAGMVTAYVHVSGEETRPRIAFTDGVRTVNVATVCGEFPKWRQLLSDPGTFTSHLTVNAQALASAAKRMGTLSGRNEGVLLSADSTGTVTVETQPAGGAQVSSEVLPGAVLDGETVRLLVSPKYLADALNAYTGTVKLHSKGGSKPIRITADGSTCRTLVMAMREPA